VRLSLRSGQEGSDILQDVRIALCGVVESWCIDEDHTSSIEVEFVRELDLSRAGPQVHPDPQTRMTDKVDELGHRLSYEIPKNTMNLTDVFPLPVAPITLRGRSRRCSGNRSGECAYAIVIGGLSIRGE